MKIAVVGAGLTGLSAAVYLSKLGHEVSVFEKDSSAGGLAGGFKEEKWDWPLEKHFHHFFTNDKDAFKLAKEINHEILIKTPKTSLYINCKTYKLDSPKDVFVFPLLSIFERIRMAATLGFLRYNPFWKVFEKYKAAGFLSKFMSKKAYSMIWEPLFVNKFRNFSNEVSLAWFWARIKKRTQSLAYPSGGFLNFTNDLVKNIESKGGKVLLNTLVKEIASKEGVVKLKFQTGNSELENKTFDKVIVTSPSSIFTKIAPQLPNDYRKRLNNLKEIGAINLILRFKKPFLNDGTYWLSVCDRNSPVMGIVEHTNFMDKKHYNNEHLVYLGNYLPNNHPYMKLSSEELLKIYDPFLRRINPSYRLSLIAYRLFKEPFAQPIIPVNYSKIVPPFETPLKNVCLANMQQVYPWDRGTNYAIELGQKIAKVITSHNE